jgi:cell division septation protein DedD
VADLTHDTAEDGFHEIQLSGKQLVFLFMAATVVSVVIFLCGVLVGRNVGNPRADDAASAQQTAAAPSTESPVAAEPPPPVPDDLTYPKRLEGAAVPEKLPQGAPDVSKPAATPSAPPPSPASTAAETPQDVTVPTSGRPGRWVVQVQALSNRAAAARIVSGLIAEGYPAFLPPPASGTALHRVQIGRYNDRREAEQVARRLQKEKRYKPDIKR